MYPTPRILYKKKTSFLVCCLMVLLYLVSENGLHQCRDGNFNSKTDFVTVLINSLFIQCTVINKLTILFSFILQRYVCARPV